MWGFCTVLGWKYAFLSPFRPTAKWVSRIKKYLVDTSCSWTTKIHWKLCALHHLRTNLILGSGKNRWKCKLWSGELGNMRYCHCKNIIWPPGAEVISPPKNFILKCFQSYNAVSITFGLRYIHGQSLNEIDFPTRNVVDRFEGDSLLNRTSGPLYWPYNGSHVGVPNQFSSYVILSLASPQTSFGVRLSRIHFSPTDVC